MKSYSLVKKIVLIAAVFIGFALILLGHLPELPSSKPMAIGEYGVEIRTYLIENLYALVLFIISLVIGALTEIYSLSMRRSLSGMKIDSNAVATLGGFILLSGLWVLTDSRTLSVFTTEYGGMLDKDAIVFISYLSFMLMPILFISFIQCILRIGRIIQSIDKLLILNLCAFVIGNVPSLPRLCYILFLAVHHALIYILMCTGTLYCLRNFRRFAHTYAASAFAVADNYQCRKTHGSAALDGLGYSVDGHGLFDETVVFFCTLVFIERTFAVAALAVTIEIPLFVGTLLFCGNFRLFNNFRFSIIHNFFVHNPLLRISIRLLLRLPQVKQLCLYRYNRLCRRRLR